ncbi:hypothetical protein [Streptomyces sp. NBC_00658]|uniref:hypothetical protein n=1 Tax=Streptomyces sp. NBC_00658 TaxID=2975800 RepID=UPI00324F6540
MTEQQAAEQPAGGVDRQEQLLEQIADLANSVKMLAEKKSPPTPVASRAAVSTSPPTATAAEQKQRRVRFAYLFLGDMLGRAATESSEFRTPRVQVAREAGKLTFTELHGGTVARLRGADNTAEVLTNLRKNVARVIKIPDAQRIDSIVVLDGPDGVPVAIGGCVPPVSSGGGVE